MHRRGPLPGLWTLALLLCSWPGAAAEGPTGWTEVQTAHVTLKTDLRPDEARRAALTVERTRAALLAAAWPAQKLLQPERIEVVVFSDRLEFQRYFGDRVGGVFAHGSYPPTAFLSGAPETWVKRLTLALEETTSILKHELTHHLAAFIYRRQPKWFSEGMAQFFETIRISEDGKSAILGDANLEALHDYNVTRSVGVADAFAWNGNVDDKDQATTLGLYGVSWVLVDWLYNTHPVDFDRYQTLLVKGVEPDKAWSSVFPTLRPGELDAELHRFIKMGDYRTIAVAIPEVEGATRERAMTSAEVHATRAWTLVTAGATLTHGNPQREAMAEISAALADDPANVRALQLKMAVVPAADRLALARRATEGHPEDGLAWLLLADALPVNLEAWDERAQALRKATQLMPDNPVAFNNLAWMELQRNRPVEALPRALTAVRMAPWNPAFLETLAATFATLGRCTDAVNTQSRAVEMLPERASPAQRAMYTERLGQFQKACTAAKAEPTAPAATSAAPTKP